MNIFSWIYDLMIKWSNHRHADRYLACVAFAESSFFPLPPDIMMLSMGLAKPSRSFVLVAITTVFSVLGGIFGYCIGYFAISYLLPWLKESHYWPAYLHAVSWFNQYGVWAVFIAGFSPIPYKIFTVSAGALHMALIPFVLASCVGRGLRFMIIGIMLYMFGERLDKHLRQYVDLIGWCAAVIIIGAITLHYLMR